MSQSQLILVHHLLEQAKSLVPNITIENEDQFQPLKELLESLDEFILEGMGG